MMNRNCIVRLVCLTCLVGCNGPQSSGPDKHLLHIFEHVGEVQCLLFSQGDKYLAAGSKRTSLDPRGRWNGQVIVWDVAARKPVASRETERWVNSIALSPDEKTLVAACGSRNDNELDPEFLGYVKKPGELNVLEFPSLAPKAILKELDLVYSVEFSPDGGLLASSGCTIDGPLFGDGIVRIWDSSRWNVVGSLEALRYPRAPIAFSSRTGQLAVGDMVLDGSNNGRIRLFEVPAMRLVHELVVQKGPAHMIAFTPDENTLAVLTPDGVLAFWEVKTGKDCTPQGLFKSFAQYDGISFSADGRFIAGFKNIIGRPHRRSSILIWDLRQNKEHAKWLWQDAPQFSSISFSQNSRQIAAGTRDGKVMLFALP